MRRNPAPVFAEVKETKIDPACFPRRVSMYENLLQQIQTIKPGNQRAWPMDKGIDVEKLKVRLSAILMSRGIKAPEGFGFFKAVGPDNSLVIAVKPRKSNKKAKK